MLLPLLVSSGQYELAKHTMQTILTSALTAALLPAGLASPTCTVESCLTAASVPWLDDTAPDWTVYTSPYNLRLPVAPRLVVPATSVAHIQDAVRCAARHGLKVAPRSGGHGYATNGLGGEDGHVVIQLDRMFGVRLREDGTAIVNAGSRLGHIATELFAQGGRAISQGLCPRWVSKARAIPSSEADSATVSGWADMLLTEGLGSARTRMD